VDCVLCDLSTDTSVQLFSSSHFLCSAEQALLSEDIPS
jgi:hypothetical protein